MIIKNKIQGSLAEVVTELPSGYLGFEPGVSSGRLVGMYPICFFSKEQWEDTATVAVPSLLIGTKRK